MVFTAGKKAYSNDVPRHSEASWLHTLESLVSCKQTSETLSWTMKSLTPLRRARPLRPRTFQTKMFSFDIDNIWRQGCRGCLDLKLNPLGKLDAVDGTTG